MSLLTSLAIGAATPAIADGESRWSSLDISGYLSVTSDYRFRGVSQSDNSAAVQGAIDVNHKSGLFVGIWASNIDFSSFGDDDTSIEVDLSLGYARSLTELTEVSIKAVYYWYADHDPLPGDPEYHYWEFIAGLSRKLGNTTLSLEVAYSPDYFEESGVAWAVIGGLDFPLCKELWFFDGGVRGSGHFGVQAFDEPANPDYTFWDLGVTASIGNFALDVRYVDNDLDSVECGLNVCDENVVVSGTFSFGE